MNMSGKFQLGQILSTPAAISVMDRLDPQDDHSRVAARLLARHHSGDWGDVDQEDWASNDRALEEGSRLFSAYGEGDDKLYVITEADRSVTTILTPGDY